MNQPTTREEIELTNTLAAVKAEAEDLYRKHGAMPPEDAEIRFHCQRAMHTLEASLYAYPWDVARILDRLDHMAAVCIRAATAVRNLQPKCPHGETRYHCLLCGTPICNLCGLWSTRDGQFCKDHKGDHMAQAR